MAPALVEIGVGRACVNAFACTIFAIDVRELICVTRISNFLVDGICV